MSISGLVNRLLRKFVKVTQINYVSRNQLYKYSKWLSNFEFWLKLAWLGGKV